MTYNADDIFMRELGGGVWFMTSFWLTVACIAYVVRVTKRGRRRDDEIIIGALGLVSYFAGSSLRGFITWMQFFYAGNMLDCAGNIDCVKRWDPTPWIQTWPLYGSSVLLNIAGAAVCIWALSSVRWRAIFTVCAVVGAVVLPSFVRWIK